MLLPKPTRPSRTELPPFLRVVHRRGRTDGPPMAELPWDMRDPRLCPYDLEYLNWYHGDPLKRSVYKAHTHSLNNGTELHASNSCGCFQCLAIYAPGAIKEWLRGGLDRTAFCPYCDTDTVLGDASGYPITPEFLRAMQGAWC